MVGGAIKPGSSPQSANAICFRFQRNGGQLAGLWLGSTWQRMTEANVHRRCEESRRLRPEQCFVIRDGPVAFAHRFVQSFNIGYLNFGL